MRVHHLSEQNSILNHFLAQLRDITVQNDRMRFRRNIERIGEIMAYELSKTLAFAPVDITTPLGVKPTTTVSESVVLCSILRAGLPMHLGFLNYFDEAENGFISAYRHHYNNDDAFDILLEYQAIPDLNGKTLLLLDPMLATGQSMAAVLLKLLEKSRPSSVHLASIIAAPEGVAHLQETLPDSCTLWIASLDEKLNEKKYIVPGLGDAGDLAYGPKL